MPNWSFGGMRVCFGGAMVEEIRLWRDLNSWVDRNLKEGLYVVNRSLAVSARLVLNWAAVNNGTRLRIGSEDRWVGCNDNLTN